MKEENWFPQDTKYNIYDQPDYKIKRDHSEINDDIRIWERLLKIKIKIY